MFVILLTRVQPTIILQEKKGFMGSGGLLASILSQHCKSMLKIAFS